VKAADQQMGGAGLLGLAQQLTVLDVAHRAGVWRTFQRCIRYFSARCQIAAQRGFEFTQPPAVVGALVDRLTRGVDIVDFGNRKHERAALRIALPNRTGADDSRGGQSEAHRPQFHQLFHREWFLWRFTCVSL
jgi:hypothetical protein